MLSDTPLPWSAWLTTLLVFRSLICYLGVVFVHEGLLRDEYDARAVAISEQAFGRAKAGERNVSARWSVEARNQLKDDIRLRGNPVTKAWAEQRNAAKYGDILGPTYEELSANLRQRGIAADSVDWYIVGSAGRTSRTVSLMANNLFMYGVVLLGCYAIWLLSALWRSPKTHRLAVAGREAIGLVIGFLGGMALSYLIATVYPF
jgi:hypothetical protein